MPKQPPETKVAPIRIRPDLIARIDQVRGVATRTAYVQFLLEQALAAEEKTPKAG